MKVSSRGFHRYSLEVVAGVCGGILTALILAAGKLLGEGEPNSISLAVRVASVAMLMDGFSFFVARYAELRGELVRAERQLNLMSPGRFASTQLGRAVLRDACLSAVITSICSFSGALLPLVISAVLPRPAWLGVAAAIVTLALLGIVLARSFYGSPARWAAALAILGALLSLIGIKLEIV